jgi:hypothetical protein
MRSDSRRDLAVTSDAGRYLRIRERAGVRAAVDGVVTCVVLVSSDVGQP